MCATRERLQGLLLVHRIVVNSQQSIHPKGMAMMKAHLLPIISLLLLLLQSCGSEADREELELLSGANFFLNSQRRDPTPVEQGLFLRAVKSGRQSGCTAFLVENTQKRHFIATQRHCYDWNISEACRNDQIRILPESSLVSGVHGRCVGVVASSVEQDVAIIEIELKNSLGFNASQRQRNAFVNNHRPLRLADFEPEVGDRLKMFGYPADRERRGNPTVSENCWVLPPDAKSVWFALDHDNLEPAFQRYVDGARNRPANPNNALLRQTRRPFNCSVYGGNSGGPIVLEGTRTVIGLPVSYYPDLYTKIPENYAHLFEDTQTFVNRHRQTLESHGILLAR
jgi:hypothetical protein